jgi:hypothetical protein
MCVNKCCNFWDGNAIKKRAEKAVICKDRIIQIQDKWNVKTEMTPVTIGVTGTVSKSHRPVMYDINELQKQPYWALHTCCGKC